MLVTAMVEHHPGMQETTVAVLCYAARQFEIEAVVSNIASSQRINVSIGLSTGFSTSHIENDPQNDG